jgi:hypothetical protein
MNIADDDLWFFGACARRSRPNSGADLASVRDVCARCGSGDLLEELIREV